MGWENSELTTSYLLVEKAIYKQDERITTAVRKNFRRLFLEKGGTHRLSDYVSNNGHYGNIFIKPVLE